MGKSREGNHARQVMMRCQSVLKRSPGFALAACLLGVLSSCPLAAQIPGLPNLSGSAGKSADASPAPVSAGEKSQAWLDEAREMLVKLEAPAAETALPEGIKNSSLTSRKRDLEQIILTLTRHLKSLQTKEEIEKNLASTRAMIEGWSGFADPPPYSILQLDELENQRDAQLEKQTSTLSSIALFERSMQAIEDETTAANENLRRLNTAADGGDAAARWRAESARIKSRLLHVRKIAMIAHIANLRKEEEIIRLELGFSNKKIGRLRGHVSFTDGDLAKIESVSADRQAALRKETSALRKRQQDAAKERTKAQEARDAALKAVPEGEAATTPDLATALARLEMATARSEAVQSISEAVEWLIQLESNLPTAYQQRRVLLGKVDWEEKSEAELALANLLDRLKAWESISANQLSSVSADLSKLDARAAAIDSDDPRGAILNEHRAALWERQAALQRVAQAVTRQRQLFERWVDNHRNRDRTWTDRLGDAWHAVSSGVRRILSIEVLRYQKGDGTGEESMRSLTLSRLFGAFFLFLIPYLVARRVIRRLQGISIRRGHIGEAQARTLLNWMMIVVGFLLALSSLKFLDIPLTVFAFLGGALAIGLGFGTQTLIKNFISGIIVLFERKIRVGDILDVDGIVGSVTEINTRSSVVRSVDGVETMIPNSLFLENRVTNLTLTNRRNRRAIRVGVAYGTSPQVVIEVLKECVARHGLILKDPEPLVLFEDFGDNALMFAVFFWVEFNDKTNAAQVASDVRIMIDKRFNELGIGVPFPQRDMHLRTDQPIRVELRNAVEDDKPS